MLYIGDKVFYPSFGAGVVINIEEREVYGDINKYYIIKLTSDIITMVPVEARGSKGIRKCISEEECLEIIEIFNHPYEDLSGKWLDRYKLYTRTIKEGNIYNMSNVLKNIIGLKKKKKISKSEEKFFKDILDMVSEEIALVLNINIDNIKMSIIKGDKNFMTN
ncbi:CarD family transcriptional regulator [Clostridium cylindrosporum]|uniref:Transcriptional regulator, CarD family n=1 Tax=Clostridium cylindrosporum DSM 605 TaxID=1121307 RepID=A0A0J8DDX1_CLOCY|nr:CarD family transcriptional regulator [Clostridium cylindrosporum]KMT22429.1 transcriptional regulator, CarD family [Clostridium cylindrosporum DSM 605]